MKHASTQAIAALEPLLAVVRQHRQLVERKPGIFYLRSRACLHFHEDEGRLYADMRVSGDTFERLPVCTAADQAAFIRRLDSRLGG